MCSVCVLPLLVVLIAVGTVVVNAMLEVKLFVLCCNCFCVLM